MSTESEGSKLDPKTADTTKLSAAQLEEVVHALIAQNLIEGLRDPALGKHPQFLAQALRFLSDNGVSGLDMPGSNVEKVKEAYKNKAPFKIPGM